MIRVFFHCISLVKKESKSTFLLKFSVTENNYCFWYDENISKLFDMCVCWRSRSSCTIATIKKFPFFHHPSFFAIFAHNGRKRTVGQKLLEFFQSIQPFLYDICNIKFLTFLQLFAYCAYHFRKSHWSILSMISKKLHFDIKLE